jgi:hypothetical protein
VNDLVKDSGALRIMGRGKRKQTGSDYKVERNKPPLETRFSSERQPEKNGRPKGPANLSARVRALRDQAQIDFDEVDDDIRSLTTQFYVAQVSRPATGDPKSWIQRRGVPEAFLSTEAAHKRRAEIRAVQKADGNIGTAG